MTQHASRAATSPPDAASLSARTSSFALLLLFMAPLLAAEGARAQASATERAALLSLYDALGGDDWRQEDGSAVVWGGAPGTECDWTGISCWSGRVKSVDLSGLGASGRIPASIRGLSGLEFLNLAHNAVTGPLPEELSRMPLLAYLDLAHNEIEGEIPDWFSRMTELQWLHLGENRFLGPLPSGLRNLWQLRTLSLGNNRFSGPVPGYIATFRNLEYLLLGGNRFSGSLPSNLGALRNLHGLSVADNDLSGPLPSGLANLTELRLLSLSVNRFTGPLPDLDRLTKMRWFDGYDNRFTGEIPSGLGRMVELESFNFSFNRLTGQIPQNLGSLKKLGGFSVGANQLTGEIPANLSTLFRLEYLNLFRNQLEGEISPTLGRLGNLKVLDVSFNRLSGPLPSELATMPNLVWLILSSNALRGNVPEEYLRYVGTPGQGVSLGWNALNARGDVEEALEEYGFRYTQTQPPENLAVRGVGTSSVLLSWDAAHFASTEGGYAIEHASNAKGPFTAIGFTQGRNNNAAFFDGLGAGPHFFRLRSVTEPHVSNQNRLVSTPSLAVRGFTADSGARGGLSFTSDLFFGAPGEAKDIEVWRLEGSQGALEADIYVDNTDTGSRSVRLRWADGEAGSKPVRVVMPRSDGGVYLQIRSEVLDDGQFDTWVGVLSAKEEGEVILASDGDRPEIARNDFGVKAVVWTGPDADQDGVFAQLFGDLDEPLGAAIRLNSQETGQQTDPSVAWDPSGKRFVAAWSSSNASAGTHVVGRFFEPYQDVEELEEEFEVAPPDPQIDRGRPVITVRRNGDIVVVWENATRVLRGRPRASTGFAESHSAAAADSAVVGRFFGPRGNALGPITQISPDDVPAGSPDVEVGYEDDLGLVYEQDPGGAGTTEVVLVDLGGDLIPDRVVDVSRSDSNSSSPSLEFTDEGDAAVVFLELQDPEDAAAGAKRSVAVKARLFDSAYQPKTDVFTLSESRSTPQDQPRLSINEQGDCFVVWQGGADDSVAGSVHGAAVPGCSQRAGGSIAVTETQSTGQPVVELENDGTITTVFTTDALAEGRRAVAGKVSTASITGPCEADETTLCLNGGRFRVTARWRDFQGRTGPAQAELITDDTGTFWFFDSSNVEMILKILDACAFADRFWVFAGGLTSVEVTMTVIDTLTGATNVYSNALGTAFAPIQDAGAFATCAAGKSESRPLQISWPSLHDVTAQPSAAGACTVNGTTLCLNGGRYEVTAGWRDADGGRGNGRAVALTGDTGYFWFYDADNVEVAVKVLDACDFSGSDWVFAAGLTDIRVVLTVTDTVTGERKTYVNPQGAAFAPIQDTKAFPDCRR